MPQKPIQQFMWGWQFHFRKGVELAVEAVLKSIDATTDIEVYLVGFRVDDGNQPICIEPEDGYYTPTQLRDVPARGAALYEQHPKSKMFYGAQHLHVRIHAQLRDSSRASALKEALEAHHPAGYVFFVGHSAVVDAYAVHTAIGIPRDFLGQVPTLTTPERHDIPIARSLVASAIDEVLGETTKVLRGPEPGSDSIIDRSGAEMARSAARRFMRSIGVLGGYIFGTPLYEVLNEVATMRYEQRVGRGRMVLAQPDAPHVDTQLVLEQPVRLEQVRTLRKLLELTGAQGIALLTDGQDIYGLGSAGADYDAVSETMFSITIADQGTWEIDHAGKGLLHVRYGRPMLPGHPISKDRFIDIASRVFEAGGEFDGETLWELCQAASKAEHGTMIVVSSAADAEAQRLAGQALRVEPTRVTPAHIKALTSIDGALLFDPTGTLHALGVILDGTATNTGDPSRGARFNSAIRYISSPREIRTMIVLVSEDGMINLLPDLRPRVSRRTIDQLIEALSTETDKASAGNFDHERFYRAYRGLENLRFYLSATQCDTINSLRKRAEQRDVDPYEIRLIENDLVPHPEMDESFFVD